MLAGGAARFRLFSFFPVPSGRMPLLLPERRKKIVYFRPDPLEDLSQCFTLNVDRIGQTETVNAKGKGRQA